jgi:alkyl sulfatase BDS1-like metallo-beta-lactamase superfamily hydrolase
VGGARGRVLRGHARPAAGRSSVRADGAHNIGRRIIGAYRAMVPAVRAATPTDTADRYHRAMGGSRRPADIAAAFAVAASHRWDARPERPFIGAHRP